MISAPQTKSDHPAPWGSLPQRMRVLYITTPARTGGWLAEAFAADSAADIQLEQSIGMSAGLQRLSDEVFDAVLVSHDPGELDALEMLEGLRAGGADCPLIVLGSQSEQELVALCYEVGADAYVCANTTTTRTLIWTVARAIEHRQLIRENRRLAQAERHRLKQEHQEASRLLEEQRALIRELETLKDRDSGDSTSGEETLTVRQLAERAPALVTTVSLPAPLVAHYRELLRTHVIMGFGNLAGEMSALADMLASADVSAQQTMQLHLQVLEELVRGLGSRSTRHVMTRADLLVLEMMVHLAEGYRRRYGQRLHPPRQSHLPGFEPSCPRVLGDE